MCAAAACTKLQKGARVATLTLTLALDPHPHPALTHQAA